MTTQSKPYSDQVTQAAETETIPAVDRAVGAAFLASGVGSFVLGLTVIGAETNASIKTFLTWNAGVGPLSGKVGLSVIAFMLSWVVLHFVFRDRSIKLVNSFVISLVLLGLGFLLTYPPVFYFLAGE